ncbi:MAG TPA: TIGR01777 family oxidoreductase [Arachidicoccus sp.]|nr:TIGR01777 family oxidoreductase [Arachidicoccus sp.]
MQKKIVLAGGTGFIGRYLQKAYGDLGYETIIISRRKEHIQWSNAAAITKALENAAVLINLAGKSVDCRYTQKNKALIFSSREETTRKLGEALLRCKQPPPVWINSSTATIYRNAEDRPMTEAEGEIGSGFSVEVGKAWEKSFFSFSLPATRQVALRIAIVLGKEGGALVPYTRLARFGLGGPQGNGREMFSWIHIKDMFGIVRFVETHPLEGIFNASSPTPVQNKEFMHTLRSQVHMPIGLPLPVSLLKVGAFIIGTSTELLLKSRWVIPEKLLAAGFKFEFPEIKDALADLIQK